MKACKLHVSKVKLAERCSQIGCKVFSTVILELPQTLFMSKAWIEPTGNPGEKTKSQLLRCLEASTLSILLGVF